MIGTKATGLVPLILLISIGQSFADEDDKRPAAGIQDNSFLIEEAYNQDLGVVQHINTLRRQGKDWAYSFTQEWPVVSQAHQFSYSIPYAWLKRDTGRERGFGDIQLNYRYQLAKETASRPAIAPRFSLILPTGDADRDLGVGSIGYQFNLPVSKIVSDRMTLHANAGLTSYVDVQGQRPTSYNLGGSMVLALSRDFNLMLEGMAEWSESVDGFAQIERERSFTLSPGFRYAINIPTGNTQVVLGAAVPIRFVEDGKHDVGAFFYFSIEHDIPGAKKEK
jgi:Putative MetA-pathway of phenol degradation